MILSNVTLPSLTLSASSNVFYIPEVVFLIVAGGGGGGAGDASYEAGGGGGAGGVTSGYFNVSTASTTATITVGQGGTRGVINGTAATVGSSSSLTYNSTTYLSTGGGAGQVAGYPVGGTGGTSGNGFLPGAQTYNSTWGGTGGGASANGYGNPAGSPAGGGGPGIYYPRFTLWGTDSTNSIIPSVGKGYFGGGGGASSYAQYNLIGPGGVGGGGVGTYITSGGDGLANTGGGGGGGSSGISGGAGAAGIVILSYPDSYPAAASTTGSPTITTANGFRYYAFTSSGSITF